MGKGAKPFTVRTTMRPAMKAYNEACNEACNEAHNEAHNEDPFFSSVSCNEVYNEAHNEARNGPVIRTSHPQFSKKTQKDEKQLKTI